MKKLMLIVTASEQMGQVLGAQFEQEYEVICLPDKEAAIRLIADQHSQKREVAMLLMDMALCGAEESLLLKERSRTPGLAGVPVVMITGNDAQESQVAAFRLGADDYVCPPFESEMVKARVANVYTSSQRLKQITADRENAQRQADNDALTGMYNRAATERLAEGLIKAEPDNVHALMLLDIDNFKQVNETVGRLVGDHTIKIIADLILSQFRKDDIVGRLGGDEFMVVMRSLKDREIARKKANELVRLLRYKPNLTIPANVSMSIGLTYYTGGTDTYDEKYKEACEALYQAKENGRGQMVEYGAPDAEPGGARQKTVIVCSRNRNVCCLLDSIIGPSVRVLEIGGMKDFLHVLQAGSSAELAFVDTADEIDNGQGFWEEWQRLPDDNRCAIFSICAEGNMKQYAYALNGGAADIISYPIDIEATQRRTDRVLRG